MSLLLNSGRDGEREASLEDTDGGNDNDSFKASIFLFPPESKGEPAGTIGVRFRGGRGGGGVGALLGQRVFET